MKLDFGSGDKPKEGYDGVDIIPLSKVTYVTDLEFDSFPWSDKSVDEIYSNHFFEHLADPKHCLNESWRVLKDEGTIEIIVPYGLWEGASKPVHKQLITECWFDFLRRGENYGYKPWDIVLLEAYINGQGQKYEVHCIMKPKR